MSFLTAAQFAAGMRARAKDVLRAIRGHDHDEALILRIADLEHALHAVLDAWASDYHCCWPRKHGKPHAADCPVLLAEQLLGRRP